jgi:hypothetical protein
MLERMKHVRLSRYWILWTTETKVGGRGSYDADQYFFPLHVVYLPLAERMHHPGSHA